MSPRNRLLVFLSIVAIAIVAVSASLADSSWSLNALGGNYVGSCKLTDDNTPKVCHADLVSGTGVVRAVRIPGPCDLMLTPGKATMVCH